MAIVRLIAQEDIPKEEREMDRVPVKGEIVVIGDDWFDIVDVFLEE